MYFLIIALQHNCYIYGDIFHAESWTLRKPSLIDTIR